MKLLITAGPTREPIDQVRFISNRSSGKVGFAIAEAARDAGHTVTLLVGPGVHLPEWVDGDDSGRFSLVQFTTTADLLQQLEAQFPEHDVLLMAAAVADYRPARVIDGKLPRQAPGQLLTLTLEPTPDLTAAMSAMRQPHQRIVAFALEEPTNLQTRAREKLTRKKADAIVANPLVTMDGDTIEPTWIIANADAAQHPGPMSKADFGRWLVKHVEQLLA